MKSSTFLPFGGGAERLAAFPRPFWMSLSWFQRKLTYGSLSQRFLLMFHVNVVSGLFLSGRSHVSCVRRLCLLRPTICLGFNKEPFFTSFFHGPLSSEVLPRCPAPDNGFRFLRFAGAYLVLLFWFLANLLFTRIDLI